MSSFVEKLRLKNVFGGQGGAGLGPPQMAQSLDMSALMGNIQAENEAERAHEIQLAGMRNQPQIRQIAQQVKAPVEKPMNVVFNPGITEYQRGTLASRAADRAARGNIAGGRLDLGREQIASREGMLDTRGDQVMDQIGARGDIGSRQIQERGDVTSRQIGERGDITSRQIGERGKITSQQIQDRGRIQEGIQETRGTQGLNQIAARGRETRLTEGMKGDMFTPGETKTIQDLAVRELINTRPDLGGLITIGTGGVMSISPDATPEQRDEINRKVFVTRPPGDITLPTNTPRYDNSSVAPKAKPKKKYKPSVIE